MGNRRCKFKSLKFLGDEHTIESLSEDVNISCDTETTEDERNDVNPKISDFETSCDDRDVHMRDSLNPIALRQAKTSFGLSERNRVEVGDGCNTRNHNVSSCGAEMHAHTRNSFRNGNTPGGEEIATDCDSIVLDCADKQSGGSSSLNCAHGCREHESKSDSSKDDDGPLVVHIGATHKTKRKKARKSNLKTVLQSRLNVSAISTDSESSFSAMEMHDTPNAGRKVRRRMTSPVKRLFASQLVQESHIPLNSKRKSNGILVSSLPKESLELGNCSIETIPNSEISDACEVSTPLRRSSRIAANLRQLVTEGTTPLSQIEKALKVLAPDTPDSEKDWTMRKRHLKGLHINSAV